MANISINNFICPVCQALLKDPVTIPCGRSFCKVCIDRRWDQEDVNGVYSCPQCRETFTPRPVLRRNKILSGVVENLKKTEFLTTQYYTEPADVECDFCIGRKHKAVKSCLVCQASYCEDHLKPHYQSPAFKKHTLVEVRAEVQEMISYQQDSPFENVLRMDLYRGNDSVVVTAKTNEKQNERKREQMKHQQRIREKEKKMQELKQSVNIINMQSREILEHSEQIFTELIRSIEKRQSEVFQLIRAQQATETNRAERLTRQLEQEICDLQSRVFQLEQPIYTPVHILQSFPSLCVSPGCEDSPSFTVNQQLSFDGVKKSLSDLKKQVDEICEEKFNQIVPQASAIKIVLPSDPKNREDFLQYYCYLTLDHNTAHPDLILWEKNRALTCTVGQQCYSNHPEQFDSSTQVMCKDTVYGRCYWEVQWRGNVSIAVSYKEINRKGEGTECLFGYNRQSWSLACSSSSLSFRHDNIQTDLQGPAPSRIGVYVDHSAGTLSFYSISDTMRLLHRVNTTFTQPLYPGFGMWTPTSTLKLCDSE